MFVSKVGAYPNEAPGACFIKLFTVVINSVALQASVFVTDIHFLCAKTNTLAFCAMELITAMKSFIIL
jgi:hypothetical protein